jgi:hypothetical protein
MNGFGGSAFLEGDSVDIIGYGLQKPLVSFTPFAEFTGLGKHLILQLLMVAEILFQQPGPFG